MRTFAQIAKEQKQIAKLYFNTPIIKTTPYVPYLATDGNKKKLGHTGKRAGKMIGGEL